MFFLKKKIILFILLISSLLWFCKGFVYAEDSSIQECKDNKISVQDCPSYLQNKINSLQVQENTLSSQIAIMDSQINLTEAKIEANKRQILDLTLDIDTATKKINTLQDSLKKITDVWIKRVIATYETGGAKPIEILLSSGSASNLLQKLSYLRIAKKNDEKLIVDVQQAKNDYTNQKDIYEEKKKKVESLKTQLEAYTAQLNLDKANKQRLLTETKGSEANYQSLLAQARAEYEAIQGIVSGKGTETEVGSVSEGSTVAYVIQGSSCNSGGTHLHFIITKDDSNQNPFSYLKSVSNENCSGTTCGSSDGDSFNPSGDWNWPIDPTIKLNQGYGYTWAVRNTWVGRIYSFHNGIDIDGSSSTVKAVKSGKLYKGSYYVGCNLRYVKLVHNDGGFTTYYLHVNYAN